MANKVTIQVGTSAENLQNTKSVQIGGRGIGTMSYLVWKSFSEFSSQSFELVDFNPAPTGLSHGKKVFITDVSKCRRRTIHHLFAHLENGSLVLTFGSFSTV
jgi:hypothetical protein